MGSEEKYRHNPGYRNWRDDRKAGRLALLLSASDTTHGSITRFHTSYEQPDKPDNPANPVDGVDASPPALHLPKKRLTIAPVPLIGPE
jgi:hypothetical protein